MKTILFNTQTNKTVDRIREGSFTGIYNSAMSKKSGWTPKHIVELTVVQTEKPQYDPVVKRATHQWVVDVEEKTYTLTWTVQDIPQEEIDYNSALADWPNPEWAKRIVAPIDMAMDDVGAKMYIWFTLNGFPVHKTCENTVLLYCNVILPQHQAIIDQFGETLTIEDRPEILNPDENVV